MLRQAEPGQLSAAGIREAASRNLAGHSRNPFVSSARGGSALSALMLPLFRIRPRRPGTE